MTSNRMVNGVDLDNWFDPYISGTQPAATGYKVGGVDLNTRYAPLYLGIQAALTGYAVNGADLNTLFAKIGTAQYVLASPGYPNLDGSAVGLAGSTLYTASVGLGLNSDGNWAASSTVTPTWGSWYAGAPIAGIGDNYFVLYTITGLTNGIAGITITNNASTRTPLSADVGCTISLKAGAGGAHQFLETGTLNIQISNSAGTVLSNVTVNVELTVTIEN